MKTALAIRPAKINFNRLREARKLAGLSRKEVATQIGFSSPHSIAHYECGRRIPKSDVLLALCELYNVSNPRVFYSD